MKIVIQRDDTQTITIGEGIDHNYFATNIEGISDIQTEINMQANAFTDGSQFVNQRFPEREIVLEFAYTSNDSDRIAKRNLLSFLNSKHDFEIHITDAGVTRWIGARLHAHKVENPKNSGALTCSATFLCSDPFFKSEDSFGKDIAAITGRLGFVWFNPINKQVPIGIYNFERQVEINNTGDLDSYPVFKILCTGTVLNPKILVNDSYVRLIKEFSAGEEIVINLIDKKITLNGTNCMGLIDRTSSFSESKLSPGDNLVKFEADNGDSNMTVNLYYYNRFVGA